MSGLQLQKLDVLWGFVFNFVIVEAVSNLDIIMLFYLYLWIAGMLLNIATGEQKDLVFTFTRQHSFSQNSLSR